MMSQPACITLTLPIPPSGNRAARTAGGQHYTPATVTAYRLMVWARLCEAYPAGSRPPLQPPYALTVTLYVATLTRLDIDNAIKTVADALCQAAGLTDGLITELHGYKRQDRRRGKARCVVELREASP